MRLLHPFLDERQELVDQHRGYRGSERTTRRAVGQVRRNWRAGRLRVHRPWLPEPGKWLQQDFGAGPTVAGTDAVLFCGWLAWSRYRVMVADH